MNKTKKKFGIYLNTMRIFYKQVMVGKWKPWGCYSQCGQGQVHVELVISVI